MYGTISINGILVETLQKDVTDVGLKYYTRIPLQFIISVFNRSFSVHHLSAHWKQLNVPIFNQQAIEILLFGV